MKTILMVFGVLVLLTGFTACEQGRTSVGTGGAPVQTTNSPFVENPAPAVQSFSPVPAPATCPIFNPVTGVLVCSCASLSAGEC